MISIIICSRKKDISDSLKENILQTIGIPYQLVVISNEFNNYSIFEAYNLGIEQSEYDFLCFMHDDILFHTKDWGLIIIEHFKNSKIAIIGVAGTNLLTRIPSFWSDRHEHNMINIIQSDSINLTPTEHNFSKFSGTDLSTPVVVVDGVWFCVNKYVLPKFKFDTKFKGFHLYDLDTCMQAISSGKQVHVIHNIILEHFSCGKISKGWVLNSVRFYKKWRKSLPVSIMPISNELLKDFEATEFKRLLKIIDFYQAYSTLYDVLIIRWKSFRFYLLIFIIHYKRTFINSIFYYFSKFKKIEIINNNYKS